MPKNRRKGRLLRHGPRLEERTRRRPGFHLFLALIVGYFLQLFPFRSLLMLFLKLCGLLTRPVLLLVCAFQLIKHLSKRSDSDAVSSYIWHSPSLGLVTARSDL